MTSDDTHTALMAATRQVLASEGYEGLTMRAVASEAEKSRGLLHYHFEDKDDLVLSLLDDLLDHMSASIRDPGLGDPLAQLDALLRWNAYGPTREPDGDDSYFRAIFALRAQAPFDPEIRRRLTRNYRQVVGECVDVVEDGIEDGTFAPVDAEATAVFLVTAVDGARNTDLTLDDTDARRTTLDAVERFVLPALLERTE